MEPGQHPDDFLFVLDECCDVLGEMGQTLHDQRHEEISLQARPPENERVRTALDEWRHFVLEDIRHMVHTMYVNNLSRSVNAKLGAGRGIAIHVVGHTSSDVQCNYCNGFGLVTQYCAILKKEHRRGPNPGSTTLAKAALASSRKGRIRRREERGR